ncbi:hypothetical protein ACSL103130_11910 [Actinomyces slackii]|uniref:Uncharacterized protein n=1 Tax=Actinomyces slackii TaxID=52774 RepID=A0A448KBS9_9ACTO|nr:hypothetical protein [Actinomyces slackii]VEG74381.1 Uncharacterised protein [Actinomyces slackii]
MSKPEYEALTELIDYVSAKNDEIGFSDASSDKLDFYWKYINHEMVWKAPLADSMATAARTRIRSTSSVFTSFLRTLKSEREKFR